MTDPQKDKLIEQAVAATRASTAGFELCELSEKVQCTHCFRCSASGNVYCRCATLFPKEQGRSGDIGTNTQAESRTTRSINISQVSLLKGQRGNRRGSTAEQEASCFFIHYLMPFTIGLLAAR